MKTSCIRRGCSIAAATYFSFWSARIMQLEQRGSNKSLDVSLFLERGKHHWGAFNIYHIIVNWWFRYIPPPEFFKEARTAMRLSALLFSLDKSRQNPLSIFRRFCRDLSVFVCLAFDWPRKEPEFGEKCRIFPKPTRAWKHIRAPPLKIWKTNISYFRRCLMSKFLSKKFIHDAISCRCCPLPLFTERNGRGWAHESQRTASRAAGVAVPETARYIRQFGTRVSCFKKNHLPRCSGTHVFLPRWNCLRSFWRRSQSDGGLLLPPQVVWQKVPHPKANRAPKKTAGPVCRGGSRHNQQHPRPVCSLTHIPQHLDKQWDKSRS